MNKYVIEVINAFLLLNVIVLFIKNASSTEVNNKKLMIGLFIIYSVVYGLFLVNNANLRTMASIFFTLFISKKFLKMTNKDSIYYSFITWAFVIILDIVIMNITGVFFAHYVLNINYNYYQIIGTLLMIFVVLMCSRFVTLIKFINMLKVKLRKMNNYYLKLIFIILLYFLLGSYCLQNMNDKVIIIIIMFIAMTLIIVISFLTSLQFQINSLRENVDLLTRNNEFYIGIIDEYRIMKHNLIANLTTIGSVGNKETKGLINDLIAKYAPSGKAPKHLKDLPTGVNGIIYEKIYNADSEKLNISINNKIKNNIIEVLNPREYNLFCEALCVALDNAIEATILTNEKILYIEFTEDTELLKMKIINTFTGTIDIDKLGTKNYSSKKKGNGLGLYSILTNKKVQVKTMIKNNKFICTVNVKKAKNK